MGNADVQAQNNMGEMNDPELAQAMANSMVENVPAENMINQEDRNDIMEFIN